MSRSEIQVKAVPYNFGPLRDAHGNARLAGPCGDTMEFWIRVQFPYLDTVAYTTDGCGHSILSGYAAAAIAEDLSLDQALEMQPEAVLKEIGGLPGESAHCALLAVNTLKAAIRDYLARQARAAHPQPAASP